MESERRGGFANGLTYREHLEPTIGSASHGNNWDRGQWVTQQQREPRPATAANTRARRRGTACSASPAPVPGREKGCGRHGSHGSPPRPGGGPGPGGQPGAAGARGTPGQDTTPHPSSRCNGATNAAPALASDPSGRGRPTEAAGSRSRQASPGGGVGGSRRAPPRKAAGAGDGARPPGGREAAGRLADLGGGLLRGDGAGGGAGRRAAARRAPRAPSSHWYIGPGRSPAAEVRPTRATRGGRATLSLGFGGGGPGTPRPEKRGRRGDVAAHGQCHLSAARAGSVNGPPCPPPPRRPAAAFGALLRLGKGPSPFRKPWAGIWAPRARPGLGEAAWVLPGSGRSFSLSPPPQGEASLSPHAGQRKPFRVPRDKGR